MGPGYRMLGFAVIAILYIVVGIMAATGTISIFRKIFRPRAEQIFYAIFLIFIALLYLAFIAYFGTASAWQLEATAVAVFIVIGLVGVRLPFALIIGYAMHGMWDMLHELPAHGGPSLFDSGRLTIIPLAYGFFCAAFDWYAAAYFYRRRAEWSAGWKTKSQR